MEPIKIWYENHCHNIYQYSSSSFSLVLILVIFFMVIMCVSQLQAQTEDLSGFKFFGDFRLRYERTTRQEPGKTPEIIEDPRNRGVVRFRVGVMKQINSLINFGARLATGSTDDPNTADITLGNFVNDLEVNIDRVFLEFRYKDLFVTGGKFSNPFFTSTDMVWDGDVNPQGLAANYTFSGSKFMTQKITGIYSIVDEQTVNPDSYMLGGQLLFTLHPNPLWSFTLAGAYYDYSIESLINADAGDTRSNYLTPDGSAYLSDFNLANGIAMLEFRGLSDQFPIRISADYVKNLGANVSEDQGISFNFYIGRTSATNDLRFQYGYADLETDAVLAAFSHDNITLATNYELHTLGIDYVILSNTRLNLTFYYYRLKKFDPGPESLIKDNDFFSRLRLNAIVVF